MRQQGLWWCAVVLAIAPVFADECDDVSPRLAPVEGEGMRFLAEVAGTVRAVDAESGAEVWHFSPPGIGEIWSVPTLARVQFGGAARAALIVSAMSNRFYMLDARTGETLWVASHPRMTYPIPARVAALDTDGDGFSDRLYVADTGGQLWRFDVSADTVVGGVLATLGARQFFQAPDVALAGGYFNLALGSGDRRVPTATGTLDRFYSIRDRRPFGRMTQAEYEELAPILDADLADVGSRVPADGPGWKLDLRPGEKVLTESVTASGTILFTTYTPTSACVAEGSTNAYALQLDSGAPALDFGAALPLTQAGIPGDLRITLDPDTGRTGCRVGEELLPVCVTIPPLRRTFWRRGL